MIQIAFFFWAPQSGFCKEISEGHEKPICVLWFFLFCSLFILLFALIAIESVLV